MIEIAVITNLIFFVVVPILIYLMKKIIKIEIEFSAYKKISNNQKKEIQKKLDQIENEIRNFKV